MLLIRLKRSKKLHRRYLSSEIGFTINGACPIHNFDRFKRYDFFIFIFFLEQIIAAARDVQEKKEIYAPYNILPLDSGATQSVVQLEEVNLV